jgi:hypothetical protein
LATVDGLTDTLRWYNDLSSTAWCLGYLWIEIELNFDALILSDSRELRPADRRKFVSYSVSPFNTLCDYFLVLLACSYTEFLLVLMFGNCIISLIIEN